MSTLAHHVIQVQNSAPAVTYISGATTFTLWGLHATDIAVMMSAFATILGVALQFYVTLHRIRILERQQVAQTITSAGNRAKLDTVEKRVGDVAGAVQAVKSEAILEARTAPDPEK